jgi:23S rRNA (uracil1939-C5)-methyltransferase
MTKTCIDDVYIERLAYGGAGVARVDGKVCFVAGAAPGDRLRVKVVANKRSYCEAEITEIITPGKGRIVPPCPIFGQCGGCQWQHLTYEAQLEAKEEIFATALQRTAHVAGESIEPILASEKQFGYRSRIQVKVCSAHDRLLFGFYRPGTHQVVEFPAAGCMLADPRLNMALAELKQLLASVPDSQQIPQVDLSVGDAGGVLAIVYYVGRTPDELSAFLLTHHQELPAVDGIFLRVGSNGAIRKIVGASVFNYQLLVPSDPQTICNMQVSCGGFSQINLRQNQLLIREAIRFLAPSPADQILDLYCGNGNFSIPLAMSGAELTGMDDYSGSITDAQVNAQQVGRNAHFSAVDAGAALKSLIEQKRRFLAIILDPPRTGAKELIGMLPQLGAQKIVYVSCDPMTLARDLALLTKENYTVRVARSIDMFPQTYHLESITLLERN